MLDNGEDPAPSTPAAKERVQRIRKPFPEHLPRDTVEHAGPSDDCPSCGGALKAISEDVAAQIEYVPDSFRVIQHVRPKFSCS